jgi:hypothetical protein
MNGITQNPRRERILLKLRGTDSKSIKIYTLLGAALLLAIFIFAFFSSRVEKPFMTETEVMNHIQPYLPKALTEELEMAKARNISKGVRFYHWRKFKVAGESELLCSLQVTMGSEQLESYHYKDYGYVNQRLERVNISKKEAETLVKGFGNTFFKDAKNLTFVNRPAYWSLYDPDHVESWVAERDNMEYLIMVDLDYGYVVYSGILEAPNTYLIES